MHMVIFRVGLLGALHPPLVSHPPFNFALRCRIGCKKIVLTSLHPNDTPPFLFDDVICYDKSKYDREIGSPLLKYVERYDKSLS